MAANVTLSSNYRGRPINNRIFGERRYSLINIKQLANGRVSFYRSDDEREQHVGDAPAFLLNQLRLSGF